MFKRATNELQRTLEEAIRADEQRTAHQAASAQGSAATLTTGTETGPV